jgi:N-carbamoyl-L-amino-acid hydrolase
MSTEMNLAANVDGARLWARLMQLGELGATGDGGVNRQAMSDLDARAHALVASWAQRLGAVASVDEFGNMFLSLAPPGCRDAILVGSHLDTQPTGGRFDGAYGVIASLEVLEAVRAAGMTRDCPIELVIWNNEEGCRFAPTIMGSSLAVSRLRLEDVLSATDSEETTMARALAGFHRALGDYPRRTGLLSGLAYIEAHIEQGPLLEQNGRPVAAVRGVQGIRQYRVVTNGAAAHAGTTPEALRKDAFVSALGLMNRLRGLIAREDDRLRFTIGSIKVEPNAINTVPRLCIFSIDLRHPDEEVLDRCEAFLLAEAELVCATVTPLLKSPAVIFDERVREVILDSAEALGLACDQFASGATHDAKVIAEALPAGMIFIPCRGGLSHTPEEWAEPEHATAGARVLAATVERLSRGKK